MILYDKYIIMLMIVNVTFLCCIILHAFFLTIYSIYLIYPNLSSCIGESWASLSWPFIPNCLQKTH